MCVYVYMYVHMDVTVHVWRLEDNYGSCFSPTM